MSPRLGDTKTELVHEAAEYLGIPVHEAWQRLSGARDRFREEWTRSVDDPKDPSAVIDFYNRSEAELFELIEWHADDPIHHRTLVVRDFAVGQPGRNCLDYGSGIGSDAVVFVDAGYDVTVADVSDVLLGFAAFRCRKRGARVHTVDLKRQSLPHDTYDVVLCLDVLEHIPEPLPVIRKIRAAMREGGLFVMHAPFGKDLDRPMHVVHHDVVTPRMRFLGYQPVECEFPEAVWPPKMYRKQQTPVMDRLGYFVYDGYLQNGVGARLAAAYRHTLRRNNRVRVSV
jgi:2-polyprenyl-3-methyl-5-hydroxy-6-metoxy-1,4-benzoquinol methylase